jgi:hypothetical protein
MVIGILKLDGCAENSLECTDETSIAGSRTSRYTARPTQYEIKSDKTDHIALHKAGVLKLLADFRCEWEGLLADTLFRVLYHRSVHFIGLLATSEVNFVVDAATRLWWGAQRELHPGCGFKSL